MEYLDLYDSNKKLTGEKIIRDKDKLSKLKDRYINIILIFIKNSEDKFLFQKTSMEKGNVIATTGGFVKAGSTSMETVFCETEEELGINIRDDNVKFIYTDLIKNAFVDVYYLEKDINISNLKLQKEEVDDVFWLSIEEIKNLIEKNKIRKGNIAPFFSILKYLNK